METGTAFLEERGDTGLVSWSHLQKLKADRGPYRPSAPLHCRVEAIKAVRRSVEMRTKWVFRSGFIYPAGRSRAQSSHLDSQFSTFRSHGHLNIITALVAHRRFVDSEDSTRAQPLHVIYFLFLSFSIFLYVSSFLRLLLRYSFSFFMILILRGLVSCRRLRSWNHSCL